MNLKDFFLQWPRQRRLLLADGSVTSPDREWIGSPQGVQLEHSPLWNLIYFAWIRSGVPRKQNLKNEKWWSGTVMYSYLSKSGLPWYYSDLAGHNCCNLALLWWRGCWTEFHFSWEGNSISREKEQNRLYIPFASPSLFSDGSIWGLWFSSDSREPEGKSRGRGDVKKRLTWFTHMAPHAFIFFCLKHFIKKDTKNW